MSQDQNIEPLCDEENATSGPPDSPRRDDPTAGSFGSTIARWCPKWLWAAALVAAVFLVYQPAWQGGFLFDDGGHVPRPELRSWHGLYRIWFDVLATQQYYPMSFSAFWVEHRLWGDATLGYHLVNIFLHATVALLLALVLRRLEVPGAYLAASIFALHPVCVESVAWITELKNTLSGVFYLGAMLLYLRFDGTRKRRWYLGALGLFLLALLSKTATVMLPAVLPVIFWWQRGRLSWKRDLLPLAPFFLAGGMASTMTVWVERATGAAGSEFNIGLIERCLIAGRAIWFYLGKLVWPFDLAFIYPRWQVSRNAWSQYLFPAAGLLLLALAWSLRGRWRGPLAALLFFAATLFPVLGFFNVYYFRYSLVADHFQYLASAGVVALFAAGVALLLARAKGWARTMGRMGCLLLLAALALLSWQQCHMYANLETLYRTTLVRNPNCWMAHDNLGNLLADRGEFAAAVAEYQKAFEIKPDDEEAHNNLGVALASRGQFDDAIAEYTKALALANEKGQPDFAKARNNLGSALAGCGRLDEAVREYRKALDLANENGQPDSAAVHVNLGFALARRGQVDEAIAQYRQALEIEPDFAQAHYNLANALAGYPRVGGRQVDEAIAHYRRALALANGNGQPDLAAAAYVNLANALTTLGKVEEAIADYRRALEIRPDYVEAHNNLAAALAGRGQIDEAIAHFRRALEIQPDYVDSLCNLGNVLVGRGSVDEAIVQYQKALDLASARNNVALAESLRSRIRLLRPVAPGKAP